MNTNIKNIANRLVELTRNKLFLQAQSELFSDNAQSIEPENSGRNSVFGLQAMQEKETAFLNNIFKWNSIKVSEPTCTERYFSIKMYVDVILTTGRQVIVDEIIIYEVENNKIIKEQFFY
ncbi:SnoaL-like domain-containing protein [Flavobacterium sp. 25HG05S-40]|uniref:SnoaL-like domain-containing protein n=1 Tax=Flavobacterium sp. 25HG05S-40 TaxID=3458682 RepID=UPI0040448E5D